VDLPRTSRLAARLVWLDAVGSTNTELVRLALSDPAAWPASSVLVTDDQTAGRGRLGRHWTAPAGSSLAISVLLRPDIPRERLGWLSLLAGTAMAGALRGLGVAATTKWPNDVLIGERKVCGVLAEALPDGSGVVVGAGLNHRLAADELPVPTATSLAIEGGPTDPDDLIAAYLAALSGLLEPFQGAGGDPETGGLRAAVEASCGTLGRRVRVSLPDGSVLVGRAAGIDGSGRIEVVRDGVPGRAAIASGDVEHLRYE
jgi:BirA family biotin operon repressor/biotin-[acetyl-CoA-carboxylase] ligase